MGAPKHKAPPGTRSRLIAFALARPEGFEPPTPGSEDRSSSPLSYGRMC